MEYVKQETDPNRNHVYIMEERSTIPEIPIQTIYRKVGVLQESTVNDDPFYGRTRALQQGNPRYVEVVFSVLTHTKKTATTIEDAVHARLRKEGYVCLESATGATGHGEWFAVPRAVAMAYINEEHAKYLAQVEQDAEFFGKIQQKAPPSKRVKKQKVVELTIADESAWQF